MEIGKKDYKYKAFISYSHKDKTFANWIHKRIENYKIPKSLREKYPNLPKNLKRSLFIDEQELPTSSVLGDNLKYALDNSKKLIVICSPFAVASKWVNEEIRYFKEVHGESSVLAIIKSGEPKALNAEEEAFPKSLRYVVGEDGKLTDKETEPLAGDARKGNDKEMALMKLIAGVLGVDFSDLWVREKKEARKRKSIFTFALTLFLALTFYASTQFMGERSNMELENITKRMAIVEYSIRHDELSTEKIMALNEELKKLKEQKEAKEDSLKTLGKLKTPIGKRALEVYDEKGAKPAIKVLTSRIALSQKEQRKKEFSLEEIALAKLYVETNEFKKAEQSFESAIAIFFNYENALAYGIFLARQNSYKRAIEIYEKLEKQKLSRKDKSGIFNNLAILYKKVNRIKEAEEAYLKALRIDRALAKTNPSAYNSDVSMTLNNLAILYKKVNRIKEAEEVYLEALGIDRALAKTNPSSYNSDVSMILNNLASLYDKVNRVKEAEEAYLESLKLYRDLAKTNPSAYNYYVSTTLNNLASLYDKVNRVKEAEEGYLEALKLYRALAKINPSAYNSDVSMTLNNLANLYNKVNRVKEAEKAYLEALKIRRALAKTNPLAYNSDVSMTLSNLANLYNKVNRVKEAEKAYLEALKVRRALAKTNPSAYNSDVSMTLSNLATLYYKINRVKEAEKVYLEALELFRALGKTNSSAYGIEFANSLVMGVDLLKQPIKNLDEAEVVLEKFKGIPKAEWLLRMIQTVREKRK